MGGDGVEVVGCLSKVAVLAEASEKTGKGILCQIFGVAVVAYVGLTIFQDAWVIFSDKGFDGLVVSHTHFLYKEKIGINGYAHVSLSFVMPGFWINNGISAAGQSAVFEKRFLYTITVWKGKKIAGNKKFRELLFDK